MSTTRHQRLRVLEALEGRLKQFRIREELWPLRVPVEPLPLDAIVAGALADERRGFDPQTLRSRTLLSLEWADGSRWDAWVVVLPSGFKLFCDTGDDESRVLASGGRNIGDESDRAFLQLLAESAGEHFGIEMAAGAAPARVRSSIDDRAFLVELFVELFEVTGMEEAIRAALADAGAAVEPANGGRDFRTDVERWLHRVLR